MSAPSPPRRPEAVARPPRRQRWLILVGGAQGSGGYVEWGDRETAEAAVAHSTTKGEIVERALTTVRRLRGTVPVCVYAVPRRGARRIPSPTWYYDPRGLPEAWAPRGAVPPKHPLPPCTCAEYGRRGDATPTRTCSVCGCPAVGGVRP